MFVKIPWDNLFQKKCDEFTSNSKTQENQKQLKEPRKISNKENLETTEKVQNIKAWEEAVQKHGETEGETQWILKENQGVVLTYINQNWRKISEFS